MDIKKLHFESDKILTSLSHNERSVFFQFAHLLKFKKGKMIFYEEGIPTGLFFIQSGKAKIYKTGIYGRDQIFYIYKEGDLFGYHALLANEKYEDACEAIEDCEILFIKKDDVLHLLNEIPQLKSLFIQNMSHEFGVLVNTITILAQKQLRQRLAINLLYLEERYHQEGKNPTIINLTRDDLANIVGTARESLGRQLKEFKDDGLIEIQGRGISILNKAQLIRVSKE